MSPTSDMPDIKPDEQYTRRLLVSICVTAIVPEERWNDRDSCKAQTGVGKAWAWLQADVPFEVMRDGSETSTDEHTIWLKFHLKDFHNFEGSDVRKEETIYLPTLKRLSARGGADWY